MFKKFFLSAAVVALIFTGCDSDSSTAPSSTAPSSTTKDSGAVKGALDRHDIRKKPMMATVLLQNFPPIPSRLLIIKRERPQRLYRPLTVLRLKLNINLLMESRSRRAMLNRCVKRINRKRCRKMRRCRAMDALYWLGRQMLRI